MSATAELRGITWDHTRGYLPMVATAQRYLETHLGIEIVWRKRSLQAFADYPIEQLAEEFDLLVIDHPFAGYAAAHPALWPLDELLPPEFLEDQSANSVGGSHASYAYGGHHWALAVDAATPVSSHRPDLLEERGLGVPETWEEVLALARLGLVALPAIPIDSLMHFYALCCGLGEAPFASGERVVSKSVGVGALERLHELVSLCAPENLRRNPIATYEHMTGTDESAYCPFAYGYSNYARPGYARRTLRFGGLVTIEGTRLRSTLGGTGLAISRACRHPQQAAEYARFVAGPECQRSLYFQSGGQPGHRSSWLDPQVNQDSGDFFLDTLGTLDDAYLRPRYDGYLSFQDEAGVVVHRYLRDGDTPRAVLGELDALYVSSK